MHLTDGRLRLHLFLDASSLEVFAAGGETVLTDLILPATGDRRLELFSQNSTANPNLRSLQMWELRPARR